MTPEEAITGVKRLQASYPTMAKLDEASITAYVQEIGSVKWQDFAPAMTVLVRTSKFFPSISEILEACDDACRKRLALQEHEEREERLAIQGEKAIFDPKAPIHREPIGPMHARFLRLLSGEETFPA